MEWLFCSNVNLYGFEVLNVVKDVVEKVCLGVVLCFDVL